jgi:hypothetical protein
MARKRERERERSRGRSSNEEQTEQCPAEELLAEFLVLGGITGEE